MALDQDRIAETLGRRVDLRTPEDLSEYFREQVRAEAKVQYEHQFEPEEETPR